MPRPEIIAHRGTPRVHPENSLAGFAHALALGVDGIELDVHLTRDGVPVVHHDPGLGGAGPLAGRSIVDLTLDELRAHELAPGVGVPTLAETCALADGRATLYVEVKARDAESAVADVLGERGAAAPVHSFDHRVPRAVRRRAPATPAGVLSVSYLVDNVAALRAADARDLWQHWSMIDAPLVEAVHAAGGRVIAWTVNDPMHAVALARLGVDGICSDVPDVMAGALAPRRD
ncbi:glycerophosphodiester phosphodiesterase [Roseisolibacter sp. H3M3-2]|uniref:glycerophosphodiester phosphodiesterase n=1 Tax=Roseisolibacter sp. H3M3-2 TaxID=3031323 RepID=UPI0023DB68F7|nr:glycerophosphodiester phosphodiesterase [Roseisolibacter sp. H3M3-2]MDF1503527.1 glycerophosphodiester phosphodiesterase [Roseisolibacter sp. H3M3-2]